MAYTIEQLEAVLRHEHLPYSETLHFDLIEQLIDTMKLSEERRKMLERIEFSSQGYCPMCRGVKDFRLNKNNHTPDCALNKLIKE